MYTGSFTAAEVASIYAMMKRPHRLEIQAHAYNAAGAFRFDMTGRVFDGGLTVDADAQLTTRAVELKVLDPWRQIRLDPMDQSANTLFTGDLLNVWYNISDPFGVERYSIPVFSGAVDTADRDANSGAVITVKGLGNDSIRINNGTIFYYPRGTLRSAIIADLVDMGIGISDFRGIDANTAIANDILIRKDPWSGTPAKVLQDLVQALGYNLRFTPEGEAEFYNIVNNNNMYTFDRSVLSDEPVVKYDIDNTVNAVQVTGYIPGPFSAQAVGYAFAPWWHPLSAQNLGRGGAPRYLWSAVNDPQADAVRCQGLAQQLLDVGLARGVDIQFTGLPNPLLQENDLCRISTQDANTSFLMKKWTLPFLAGADASFGTLFGPATKQGESAPLPVQVERPAILYDLSKPKKKKKNKKPKK